jgi:hypothetical protein
MTHFPTPEHERLARVGMYHPEMEGDACGVGLIAATDGKASRRVVASAIDALKAAFFLAAFALPNAAIAQESGATLTTDASQSSPEILDSKRQLATEIVALISGVQNTEAALSDVTEPWVQQMLQTQFSKRGLSETTGQGPEYTKRLSEVISPIIRETFLQFYPALREEQIDIWTNKLDEPSLRKIKRFFSTNFFKKMAAILHNPTNDDFSPEGQLEAKLAALNSITKADIAEIESQADFDPAMADSMNVALVAWTERLESWKLELTDKLEGPVKNAMAEFHNQSGKQPLK